MGADPVTDLDPNADYVYRFAGVILPWEANQADDGIRLLEKGVRNVPDSWLMHFWLGFNYYFFKSDTRVRHATWAAPQSCPEPTQTPLGWPRCCTNISTGRRWRCSFSGRWNGVLEAIRCAKLFDSTSAKPGWQPISNAYCNS